jgi:iron complex outermembrane receptor protein
MGTPQTRSQYTAPSISAFVLAASLLTLLSSTAATPSLAQATTQENPDLRKSRMLEEVLVTAQKRSENNQDVPISVTAFNSDTLDALGVSNPQDLQRVTPGLTYTTTEGASIIYLRGVGSDAYLMADPSVALYIDDVYFPFAQGLAQSFGAIEGIEVLKGPQGTLFGRNAVVGAINIHSMSPGPDPEASIQFAFESYNTQSLRLYGSYPITDTLAISVSAFKNSNKPYYDG